MKAKGYLMDELNGNAIPYMMLTDFTSPHILSDVILRSTASTVTGDAATTIRRDSVVIVVVEGY